MIIIYSFQLLQDFQGQSWRWARQYRLSLFQALPSTRPPVWQADLEPKTKPSEWQTIFQLFLTYDLDFQTCIFTNIYMQKLIFISIIHMVTNLVLEWSWETKGNVYIYGCIILHGLPQSHTLFPFLEYSSRPMFTPMGRAFGTRLRQLRKQQPCILCCKRCNLPTNKRPKIQTSMYCKICSNYFCQNDSRLCMISPWGARRRSCYGEAI